MVFHYFDGFGPKWIALVIALGGSLASGATYVYRGHGKSYFDEMNMQDSESVLAPTTKSMQKKVNQVPQTKNSNASASSPAAFESESSDSASHQQQQPPAASESQFTYRRDETNNKFSETASKLSNQADKAAQSFGDHVQQAAAWVAENPKTTIAFVLLCYAVQHLGRKVLAHQHYEDRLVAEKRVSSKALESGTSFTTSTSNNTTNNYDDDATPSAVASNVDYSILSSETTANGDEGDSQQENKIKNTFPVSTWASRARPEHADPEFEKIVQNLSREMLEEYTSYLLPSMNIKKEDADLVTRVREELLSIAPAKGWKAEIIEESFFKGGSSEGSPKNEDGDDEDNNNYNASGSVVKAKVFRFIDRFGEVKPVHDDAEFALEMLQREAAKREATRLNAQFFDKEQK